MGIGNRIKGAAEELGGKAKEALGNLTDDERLRREGISDQGHGQGRQDVEKAGQQVEGTFEKAGGRVKGAAGALSGDERKQAEGKFEELKGEVRQKLNK
ncbi:CsbD family protein [Polyangium jinanense]|uniref:CsbD family protein n=1 Tax=Polyangium jinanense TaxID=2829994 RepID=A0A9X3XJL4_9BACT|nr:CsbD family protein [Polyangium jinanense]MDC3962759.1 CsbD family protein [Polyangium jinanense]MDC3989266.1 CsbD family protein [Polyangium jinanense]